MGHGGDARMAVTVTAFPHAPDTLPLQDSRGGFSGGPIGAKANLARSAAFPEGNPEPGKDLSHAESCHDRQ
jgi:hypothetical protein